MTSSSYKLKVYKKQNTSLFRSFASSWWLTLASVSLLQIDKTVYETLLIHVLGLLDFANLKLQFCTECYSLGMLLLLA